MKPAAWIATLFTVLLGTLTPAFAASGVREDNSSLVVWAFLALGALIILAQLLPVLFMAFGLVKGITESDEKGGEPAVEKYPAKKGDPL